MGIGSPTGSKSPAKLVCWQTDCVANNTHDMSVLESERVLLVVKLGVP